MLLLGACTEEAGTSPSIVRDSAGITIVENTAPAWQEGAEWRIDAAPEPAIGLVDGPPELQLFRVTGALRLDDGRIVVANSGTSELRFYDTHGSHLHTAGGRGEGPGEFTGPIQLFRWGADSLVAWDGQLLRISVFSNDGAFARAFPVARPDPRASPRPAGIFDDGTVFIRTGRVFSSGDVTPGISRDSSALYRLRLDGTVLDTLGVFPGSESFVTILDGGFMVDGVPFSGSLAAAIHGNRVFIGRGDTFEFEVRANDGTLLRIVRLARANAPVTPEDIDAYRRQRLEGIDEDGIRQLLETELANTPFPEWMPPYAGLFVDALGNVWIEAHQGPGQTGPAPWLIFDADGRLLGEIPGIDRFFPYDVGDDYILGRRLDELDVERVELYRIRK
jgi:hypothetical protein